MLVFILKILRFGFYYCSLFVREGFRFYIRFFVLFIFILCELSLKYFNFFVGFNYLLDLYVLFVLGVIIEECYIEKYGLWLFFLFIRMIFKYCILL